MLRYSECLLRPMEENDLVQILNWRNSERIREVMFSDHIITWEEHLRWSKNIFSGNANVKVFIFEFKNRPLGSVSLNNIDLYNKRCNWGFYIGDEDAPKGSGLAMGFLALEYVFEKMHFNILCSEVLASNIISQKYHLKLGFRYEGCFKRHVYKKGKYEDVFCYGHFKEIWNVIKVKLFKKCFEEACCS